MIHMKDLSWWDSIILVNQYYSFILSNHLILVRVTVYGMEYNLDGMPTHCRVLCTHSFIPRDHCATLNQSHVPAL